MSSCECVCICFDDEDGDIDSEVCSCGLKFIEECPHNCELVECAGVFARKIFLIVICVWIVP